MWTKATDEKHCSAYASPTYLDFLLHSLQTVAPPLQLLYGDNCLQYFIVEVQQLQRAHAISSHYICDPGFQLLLGHAEIDSVHVSL